VAIRRQSDYATVAGRTMIALAAARLGGTRSSTIWRSERHRPAADALAMLRTRFRIE